MKRLLALVLSFCLILSCLPFGAIALEAEPEIQTEPQIAPQSEEINPAQEQTAPVLKENTHADHGACICAVKGSTCSHTQLTWTAWESTTSLPTEAGNYYLTGKVTLAALTTISANVNICLNGFDIDLNQTKIVVSGNVTVMNCQAQLNANNQLTSTAGKLYNGKNASTGTNVEKYGGAIGVTGTLNVYGVLFSGNTCAQTSDARTGGAIYVQNGTANIESCSFSGNTSKGTGGAVMLYGGTMTIKDSLFTNNEAAIRGGAIGVNSKEGACTLTIGGNTEITGSKTTDTRTTAFYGAGGAVFAYKNGTANVSITIGGNTKITGNTASQEGGAIALRNSDAAAPMQFKLQDNVQIYGNAGEGTYDNLYFEPSQKVTVGTLGTKANVRINAKEAVTDPDEILTLLSGASVSETVTTGIYVEDKAVAYNAADLFYYPGHAHQACVCAITGNDCGDHGAAPIWTAWESTTTLPTEAGNYYLTDNVKVEAKVAINGKVNLCLNGFSIDLNEKYIEVGGTDDLTILNCQAQLKANGQLDAGNARITNGKYTHGAAVVIAADGKFTAVGIEFYKNNNYRSGTLYSGQGGGAVYNEGTTKLYACRFIENTSNNYAGAVAQYNNGTVSIDDCYFSGNSAVHGGALSVYAGSGTTGASAITITGDTEITGNTATDNGGAVTVYRNTSTPDGFTAKLILKDNTVITGNTAGKNGGGIYYHQKNGDVEVSGDVQITGNTAGGKGPNIYMWDLTHKLTVGKLGASASIGIFTGDNFITAADEPDDFLQLASGVNMSDTESTGLFFEKTDPVKRIGYNSTDKFYYVTEPVAEHKDHGACICAITGDTCSHEQLTWTAWESTTTLPTEAGNYYLTDDVKVEAKVAINGKVNLCLNGFSIDLNEKYIEVGGTDDLTILNCQAQLKANGQLAEGNAKITNGKHTHGAAVMTAKGGKFTAIGVEFADNNNYRETPPTGQGGGAVYFEGEGALYACRFVNNTSNNCGGAVAVYVSGSVKIDDCYFSDNSATSGGALSVYTGGSTTANVVATLTGDNEFVGNEGNNGGALYVRRHANTPAAYTAKIILEDNCKINGNNAKNNGGAVYFEGANAALEIRDNVQIIGNTAAGKGPNVYVWDLTHKLTVGELGASASIGIFTGDNFITAADEPDDFLQLASGVNMSDTENTGLFFEKTDPVKRIGYNSTDKFYYVVVTAVTHEDHGACSCAITGDTCSHGKLTWKPWTGTTALPTAAGNYFLTADVTLAAVTGIAADVNICLNGYDINLNGKKIHNTGSLGIMNCQGAVNDKNQLTSENGKIYNGKYGTSGADVAKYGGAIGTSGDLTLIGVLFTDNLAKGADARTGGALYVEDGMTTIESCKFEGNQALSDSSTNGNRGVGGAISVYKNGSLHITDSVFENNTADLYGGAIGVNNRYATADSTVTIDGNCEFTGNKTTSTTDGYGAALFLYARSEDGGKLSVNIGGNTKITGNTAAKYGAVYLRTHDNASAALNFVVADNVSICDNTASTEQAANIYMHTMKQKIHVGQLGADVRVFVGTPAGVGDPDEFMVEQSGVTLENMEVTGFFYANKSPAISIGHSTDDAVNFYFDMEQSQTHTDHSLCDCFLSGESCTDSTRTWKAWIYDDQLPTTAGNWYLTCDVKVAAVTSVKAEGVNVCLNGFNIDLNEKYISVGSAGELTIINCKAVAKDNGQLNETKSVGGKLTNGKHTHGAAVSVAKGGKLTAIGVEFAKNTNYRESPPTGQGGGAVYNEGTAELYACRFADNTSNNFGGAVTVYVTGNATINDCCFTGNSAVNGGALSVYTGGSSTANVVVTLTGDNDFVGNTASGQGGAIMVRRHANTPDGVNPKLETKGNVKITENVAVKDGGGIAIVGSTTDFRVDLTGVLISKNKANRGGGIYIEKAKLVGTTITVDHNSAEGTGSSGGGITGMGVILSLQTNTLVTGNKTEKGGGGGIYVSNASTVNLFNCTVSKNESPDGGGVRLWRESVLNMKGGKITGNNSTATGGGVSLVKGSILNMESGEISNNTSEKNGAGVYADNYFQSVDPDYELPQLNLMGGTISENVTTGSYGGGIYAKNCHTKLSGTKITKNVGEKANGGGVYVSMGSTTVEVEENGELVQKVFEFEPSFIIEGGEISGNKAKNGAGVYSNSVDTTFTGGAVKNNAASENAGGMSVRGATLTIKDKALVSGNTGKSGGGIIIQGEGTVNMSGGTVEKNSAKNAGGLLLWSRSTVNLRGGSVRNNKATKGSGGGIYVQSGAHLKMSGGNVSYNTVTSNGGGIYATKNDAYNTRVTVSGGSIVGNYAKNSGGGMYTNKGAIANIYGGSWKSNEVKVCGGAIYANASDLNLYGGTFTENHAVDCGGAINGKTSKILVDGATFEKNIADARGGAFRIHTDCEFTLKSGKINNNEAGRGGGAVALYNCKVANFDGGEIIGNKVLGNETYPNPVGGGAINVTEGTVYTQYDVVVNITGTKIAENYSLTNGGAIVLNGRSELNISGGEIVNNVAEQLGGAVLVDAIYNPRAALTTLNVTGGKISGNTATDGGAIYARNFTAVNLDGATIEGNTANGTGGALYLGKGTRANLKDSLLTKNTAAEVSGFYAADDLVMHNLEVTNNNSKTGYAAYIDKGEFDGRSYVLSIIKMSGDIRITGNNGGKGNLFLGEDAKINIGLEGLGKNTLINLELEEGVLTNTIIGAYNYEGRDRIYTVTYGDRSLTDLEPIPTEAVETVPEETQPVTEPQDEVKPAETSIVLPIALGAAALAIVIIVLILLLKRKKNGGKKV